MNHMIDKVYRRLKLIIWNKKYSETKELVKQERSQISYTVIYLQLFHESYGMNVVSSLHTILQTSGVLFVFYMCMCVHACERVCGVKHAVCVAFLCIGNMHKHAHIITYVAVSFLVFSEIQLVCLCTKKDNGNFFMINPYSLVHSICLITPLFFREHPKNTVIAFI